MVLDASNQQWHELLEIILRRGQRDAASAMKGLLKTLGEPLLLRKDH